MENIIKKTGLTRIVFLVGVILSGYVSAGSELVISQQQSSSKDNINISSHIQRSGDAIVASAQKQKQPIWKFVKEQMKFNIPDNAIIAKERAPFLKNKRALNGLLSRAEPYIYLITEELIRRDMPVELLLIPMIESAFTTVSVSSQKAVGLWQIMPETAKRYNDYSKASSWFEPRRDILESTHIALNMFQSLNKLFDGDWLLTIAAYNSGQGRVLREMEKNRKKHLPTHFWALDLPKETKQYVPKMLALADLIKNNKKYGVELPTFSPKNSLVKLDLKKQFELSKVAKASNINVNVLKEFNAGYLNQKSHQDGPHLLIVPVKYAYSIHNSLAKQGFSNTEIIDTSKLFNHFPAKAAKAGKNASSITTTNKRYNTVTNTEITKIAKAKAKAPKQTKSAEPAFIHYKVKKGDSLIAIARKHKVKINDLRSWNNLKDNTIKIGKTLKIKGNKASA